MIGAIVGTGACAVGLPAGLAVVGSGACAVGPPAGLAVVGEISTGVGACDSTSGASVGSSLPE